MKLFIFILLTFSALNPALVYSSCEEAFSRLTSGQKEAQKSVWNDLSEALVPLTPVQKKAQKSVWEVLSPYRSGTGFFINQKIFVTPFFAVGEVFNLNDINAITLIQNGDPRTLRIKRIMHFSVSYGLAVLEIEEKVSDYLKQGIPPNPKENLSAIGYSNGNVQVINTTGDIFDNSVFNRTTDPGRYFNNSGASGSPVLNTDGEVVGVYHAQNGNVLRAVKIIHLQNLLKQKVEVFKSPKGHLEHSIKEAIEAAEQGDASAQGNLGYLYGKGLGVKQDYEKAFNLYRQAADQGHAIAQYYLGFLYFSGQGVEQNHKEALKWWTKAADQGHAPAQYSLALSYYLGDGVERDYKKAFDLCKKAADQGHASAQFTLAIFYQNGLGVKKDYQEAVKWYEKAAK